MEEIYAWFEKKGASQAGLLHLSLAKAARTVATSSPDDFEAQWNFAVSFF